MNTPISKRNASIGALIAALVTLAFIAGRAWAGGIPANNVLTYAGTLTHTNGAPLDGEQPIEIKFWPTDKPGMTPLCQTSQTYALIGGRFSIPLPSTCADAVKANADVWVETLVQGRSLSIAKLGATPYALEAGHATTADTASAAASSLADTLATMQGQIAALQEKPAFQVRNGTSKVTAGKTVVWDAVEIDTHSKYNPADGTYTIPVAGNYRFYFDLLMPNAPAGEYRYALYLNRAMVHTTIVSKPANAWQTLSNSSIVSCAVGDTVSVFFVSGAGETYTDPPFNVFYGQML